MEFQSRISEGQVWQLHVREQEKPRHLGGADHEQRLLVVNSVAFWMLCHVYEARPAQAQAIRKRSAGLIPGAVTTY